MSKDNIYYVSEKLFYGNTAGTKARNDLEELFNNRNYKKIGPKLVSKQTSSIFYYLKGYIISTILKKDLGKLKNKTIIFQYPITRGKVLIPKIKKISKNNNIVLFIHDISYLRSNLMTKEEEINFLNHAKILVCHNERMKEKLISDGISQDKLLVLECFDYLLSKPVTNYIFDKSICYAGNLDKGTFLGKCDSLFNYKFNLFGPNYSPFSSTNINYIGNFSPDIVPYKLNSSYGLIWDSTDIDTCKGILGDYTKYNNPHKFSLYMASGIPVFAWEESYVGSIIKKYNLGFTINSLKDINTILDNLTEEEYKIQKNNVLNFQNKICNGEFTLNILNEIEKKLGD